MLIFENSTNKLDILSNAISNKYAISFWYVGKDYKERKKNGKNPKQNWRRVEPFALGKTKNGDWILRAYQYGGVTNTKNKVYKTYSVDEIKDGSISLMYDKTGENLQTFSPKSYIDNRGVTAAFRTSGSDKGMKGGVDTFYNVRKPGGSTNPNPTPEPEVGTEPAVKPNLQPTKPSVVKKPIPPKPIAKPLPTQPVKKPIPLPKSPVTKPVQPVPEPMPNAEKINPDIVSPEEEENEWVPEPVTEGAGFLKWILNLSHGSR